MTETDKTAQERKRFEVWLEDTCFTVEDSAIAWNSWLARAAIDTSDAPAGWKPASVTLPPAGDDVDLCPVCAEPIRTGDLCATDIETGACHAACLEGSPVVDLETGEPAEGVVRPLGRFGHHPDHAVDFCIEVEVIEGEVENLCIGFANGTPPRDELSARIERALAFRVGGDEGAVRAKDRLREVAAKFKAASASAGKVGPVARHPDDVAVEGFAKVMSAKLACKRALGYGGWDDKAACSNEHLSGLLRSHVEKGDPVDVANFAMMIHQRGERIVSAHPDAYRQGAEEMREAARMTVLRHAGFGAKELSVRIAALPLPGAKEG